MNDSSPDGDEQRRSRDDGASDGPRNGENGGFGDGDADGAPPGDGPDEGEVWRFGLDEVDGDGIVQSTIEPGNPSLENVLFVVLGVLGMVLLIVWLWSLL